jgi:hypothetical protein
MSRIKFVNVISPLAVYMPRKTMPARKYILNLNNYRNWKFIVSAKLKRLYTEAMGEQLKHVKIKGKFRLYFTYYKPTKRISDRSNVLAIHEKFFCDALRYWGCIKDDNDKIIEDTSYMSGEFGTRTPCVLISIEEI